MKDDQGQCRLTLNMLRVARDEVRAILNGTQTPRSKMHLLKLGVTRLLMTLGSLFSGTGRFITVFTKAR
jgi:hypothetical protein